MTSRRVTVTLPPEVVAEMDHLDDNRSRFVLRAVRAELERRRREELRRSLTSPHPDADEVAEQGIEAWAAAIGGDDEQSLVDPEGGAPVRWRPGKGWQGS